MTISEAITKLSKIKDNANVDDYVKNMLSCIIEDLRSYKNILGDIELDKSTKQKINGVVSRLAQDTVDHKWVSDLKSDLSSISKMLEVPTSNKISKTHVKFIKTSCAILVIIAIAAAAVAIYGVIAHRNNKNIEWPDIVSSILGTVDFVFGVIAFATERITDIKGKQVSNAASKMSAAINYGDLEAVQQASKEFKKAANEWNKQVIVKIGNIGLININWKSPIINGNVYR